MKQINYKSGNITFSIAFLFAIIIVICLTSCGARRVNKSNTEIKETANTEISSIDTSKTVTKTDTNIKIIDSSISDEFIIEPIDSSKVSTFNNVTFKNSRLKHKKIFNNKVVDKTETIAKNEQKAVKTNIKSNKSKTTNVAVKNTERKSSYWRLLWFLLIIPIIIAYRKFKDNIWWV